MNFRPPAASLAALSLALSSAAMAEPAAEPMPASVITDMPKPAPLSDLIKAVSIPYQKFTLPNGLRVLVNTDRKAPVVAVSVWYAVGSKNEPKGKTGFAHLFEHLMFNGSEHSPGDFFAPLQDMGATDYNGTTWFDRTNYFETVPTAGLDRVLMLESDRMGYLLGAMTQEKLDNQRSVVQNEKRQGDNQPYGLVEYEELENLYPSGNPYHHSTIGSMADLNSATLDDVKSWFRDHYAPNNAILVLSGDVDLATAKAKVAKWFGAIPSGPKVKPVAVPVPTLPAPLAKTIFDRVPTPRIYRMWAIPGLDNPDHLPLEMGATVLGGLASSRLDNVLVKQKQLAVRVSASADIFAQGGQMVIYADARPGVDEATLAKALDEEIAKFIAEGPTADELQRSTTAYTASEIRGLDRLGGFSGKAPTLAQGLLYEGDPAAYKTTLERAVSMTPAEVQTVTSKWLSRPVFDLTVEPGDRKEGGENRASFRTAPASGEGGAMQPSFYSGPFSAQAAAEASAKAGLTAPDRSSLPPLGKLEPLKFPAIERTTLSNGMKVLFVHREGVPVASVQIQFDAGFTADPKDKLGLQSMMLQMMDEGTTHFDSNQLAIEKERLGMNLGSFADMDTTSFSMNALVPNLAASLDLMADYISNPAFKPDDLERVRAQQLNRIKGELSNPGAIAQRALAPIIYGPYPYGIPPTGTGEADVVSKLMRDELSDFHQVWIRPDTARIYMVGDVSLAEATKLLETSFGSWKAPDVPVPVKDYSAAIPTPKQRIVLIDRPNSPQSLIYAGQVLTENGTDDLVTLRAANQVFGGDFLSRINMDLRETKGWSYGVSSQIRAPLERIAFTLYAPVQSDKTGDSIAALRKDLAAYTSGEGVTQEELARLIKGNVRELPGSFETANAILGGVRSIDTYGRPDNYYDTLAARYQALTADQLDQAAKENFVGKDLVYVVVGDAKVVRPQLDQLGLPVEVRQSSDEK